MESYEQARNLVDRALRLKPDDPMSLGMRSEAVTGLAAAQYRNLDAEQADRLEHGLNTAIEASPRSDFAFWTRAQYRIYVRRVPDAALEDVRRTLMLSPAYAPGFELLGLGHMLRGDFLEAEEALEKSLSLSESDPFWPYRCFMLAVSQLCAGKPDEAAGTIGRAIQLRPNVRSYLALQAECYRRGGQDRNLGELERQIASLPRDASILAPRPPLPDGHDDLLGLLSPAPR
jgi:tetratricopeptide (TPR) repeat protein